MGRVQRLRGRYDCLGADGSGRETFTNSLHYHRQRGLLCGMGNCANCLVQVGGRAGRARLHHLRQRRHGGRDQNTCTALSRDALSSDRRRISFLPAGYVYKNFMQPRELFPAL